MRYWPRHGAILIGELAKFNCPSPESFSNGHPECASGAGPSLQFPPMQDCVI
jgi:hypothetical protein